MLLGERVFKARNGKKNVEINRAAHGLTPKTSTEPVA